MIPVSVYKGRDSNIYYSLSSSTPPVPPCCKCSQAAHILPTNTALSCHAPSANARHTSLSSGLIVIIRKLLVRRASARTQGILVVSSSQLPPRLSCPPPLPLLLPSSASSMRCRLISLVTCSLSGASEITHVSSVSLMLSRHTGHVRSVSLLQNERRWMHIIAQSMGMKVHYV